MHHSRLVWTALALWAVAGTTTLALACDTAKDAQTSAVSASATCTAAMAAKCTPEMAAACKAHGASAAAMSQCSAEMAAACKAHGASAAAMSQCSMKGAKATSASASGCSMAGAAVTADANACAAHGTAAAVTADAKACPHGAVSATVAGGGATCGMKGAAAAGNSATCSKGAAATTTAGNASKSLCSGEGLANVAGSGAHADCDACGDMVKCAEEISAAGGRAQMVPLKNGMMFVYTAESAAGIRAIKQAVSERSQRLATYSSAGGGTHLCPQCKAMRGAAASGKLTREVVSIEGGCLTLMTSNDPAIIAQLHAMTGMAAARTKS